MNQLEMNFFKIIQMVKIIYNSIIIYPMPIILSIKIYRQNVKAATVMGGDFHVCTNSLSFFFNT